MEINEISVCVKEFKLCKENEIERLNGEINRYNWN